MGIGAAVAGGLATGIGGAAASSLLGDESGRIESGDTLRPPQRRRLADLGAILDPRGAPRYAPEGLGIEAVGQEYPGRLPGTVSLTDLEQQSLTGIENVLGGETLLQEQQEAISNVLDPDRQRQQFENFYEQTIAEPLQERYEEEIAPSIAREYAPSGFWSGERMEAEREAREDLMDVLGRERARLGYQDYVGRQERMLRAAGMAPQAVGAELGMFERGLEAGRIPHRREERELQAEYEEWRRQQEEYDEYIDQLLGFAGQRTQQPFYQRGRISPVRGVLERAGGRMVARGSMGLLDQAFRNQDYNNPYTVYSGPGYFGGGSTAPYEIGT